MHRVSRILISILSCGAICFLALCSKEPKDVPPRQGTLEEERQLTVKRSLISLEFADPDSDAVRAIARGDIRFIGVMGYAVEVPGVENYLDRFKDSISVRVLEGTTDTPETDDDRLLHDLGWKYAERFNTVILKHLENRNNPIRQRTTGIK